MPRLALSLETLRAQLNALAPNRSKVSDGWIGDAAHSARKSDHNPNRSGVVCALDITHDPENGMDCHKLAEQLQKGKDPRIGYVIWNGQIMSGSRSERAWVTRPYTGTNPHRKHLHVSVVQESLLYDDGDEWTLAAPAKKPTLTVNGATIPMVGINGNAYAPVRMMAEALGASVHYDPATGNVKVTK
jgi:hypothetical protein